MQLDGQKAFLNFHMAGDEITHKATARDLQVVTSSVYEWFRENSNGLWSPIIHMRGLFFLRWEISEHGRSVCSEDAL